MSSAEEFVHKQLGSYLVRGIALIAAIEVAFFIEDRYKITDAIKNNLPSAFSSVANYIDHAHLVSVIAGVFYIFFNYIIIMVTNIFSAERSIRGRYISLPDADASQINILRIKMRLFDLGHTLTGVRYTINPTAQCSGSWHSRTRLDTLQGDNNARISYIYSGESQGAFTGRGFTAMVLRNNNTGDGFWLDNKRDAQPESTIYFKVTRHLRKVMLPTKGAIGRAILFFRWNDVDIAKAYASLPADHQLRKRPAQLP